MKRAIIFLCTLLVCGGVYANTQPQYCADISGTWRAVDSTGHIDTFTLLQQNANHTISGSVTFYCAYDGHTYSGAVDPASNIAGNGVFNIYWYGNTCDNGNDYNVTFTIPKGQPGCDAATIAGGNVPAGDYSSGGANTQCFVPNNGIVTTSPAFKGWPTGGVAHFSAAMSQPNYNGNNYNYGGRVVTGRNSGSGPLEGTCAQNPPTWDWPNTPFTGANTGYSGNDYQDYNQIDDFIGFPSTQVVNNIRRNTQSEDLPCGETVSEQLFIDCPTSAGGPFRFVTNTNTYLINNEVGTATVTLTYFTTPNGPATTPPNEPFGTGQHQSIEIIEFVVWLGAMLGPFIK